MMISKSFPKFEANQILTAEQLNGLAAFLEQQPRLTRHSLLGVGIACGMHVEFDASNNSLKVTRGSGVTSEGYHVRVPETGSMSEPHAVYTHYTPYVDPTAYGFFQTDKEKVKLWELLEKDTNDTGNASHSKLTHQFLSRKAVLIFVEVKQTDLATCTGNDCDEKGIRIDAEPRVLVIETDDLRALEAADRISEWRFLDSRNLEKYSLPTLHLGRLTGLARDENWVRDDLAALYVPILRAFRADFSNALKACYNLYRPVLGDSLEEFPDTSLKLAIELPEANNQVGIQCLYDHFRHLRQAYIEFTDAALELSAQCCPDENAFPRHLVLGLALGEPKDGPSNYRQEFLPSPILTGEREKARKVRELFIRMVVMAGSFQLPEALSADIRVTPSRLAAPLGRKAIPFYYPSPGHLDRYWNSDLHRRGLSQTISSYYRNSHKPGKSGRDANKLKASKPAKFQMDLPLALDLEPNAFFRVEGHLGKPFEKAFEELSKWVTDQNLPIKVVGLKLGKNFSDIDVAGSCRFEDLEILYFAYRGEFFCMLDEVQAFVGELKFEKPEPPVKAAEEARVVGRVLDEGTRKPMANVLWEVEKTKARGRTDSSGSFEILDLDPGEYMLLIQSDGFLPKAMEIVVHGRKEVDLGDIPLRPGKVTKPRIPVKKTIPSLEPVKGEKIEVAREDSGGKKTKAEIFTGVSEESESRTAVKNKLTAEKEMEEEMVMAASIVVGMAPMALKSAGNFQVEDFEPEPKLAATVNSVSQVVRELKAHEAQGKVFDFLEEYVYEKFAGPDKKVAVKIVDEIFYPVILNVQMETVRATLPQTLDQFVPANLTAGYAAIVETVGKYRRQLEEMKRVAAKDPSLNAYSGETFDALFRRLDRLEGAICLGRFPALAEKFQARREEIQRLHLFSVFASEHPGLEALCGVPSGGTLLLVYDSNQVIFDFALPYICDSICPPVDLTLGPPAIFKLPKATFSTGEDADFKFIVNPPGGDVDGPGVRFDKLSGDHFFNPSSEDVKAGHLTFYYRIFGATHTLSVPVEEFRVGIRYEVIGTDMDLSRATVEFSPVPDDAAWYSWTFSDGQKSELRSPRIAFDVSEERTITATLECGRGDCTGRFSQVVAFGSCDATFTFWEVGRGPDWIQYQFSHPQVAKERTWNFSDGKEDETRPDPIRTYRLEEVSRDITVTLAIKEGDCTDTHEETLAIPSRLAVKISLPESVFTKADRGSYPFLLEPPGGRLEGPGVVRPEQKPPRFTVAPALPKFNLESPATDILSTLASPPVFEGLPELTKSAARPSAYAFQPAHPDVLPGTAVFTYTYGTQTARLEVEVQHLVASIQATILPPEKDLPANRVQFTCDIADAEYTWNFGDESTSKDQNPMHVYETAVKSEFEVVLLVKKGKAEAEAKTTVKLEVTTAEFSILLDREKGKGLEMPVTFIAAGKGVKQYFWNDGQGAVVTTTGPEFSKVYPLLETARVLLMKLEVRGETASATLSRPFDLPAALPLTLSIADTTFGKCDDTHHAITVSPPKAGRVEGRGAVKEVDGAWSFVPFQSGVGGPIDLSYAVDTETRGTVRSPAVQVRVLTPAAEFRIGTPTDIGENRFEIRFINESRDADTWRWVFSDGQVSDDESPTLVFQALKGSNSFLVARLIASQGKCESDSGPVRFRLTGRDPEVTLKGIFREFQVLEGNPAIVELLGGEALDSTDRILREIIEGIGKPDFWKEFTSGKRNRVFAETLGTVMLDTAKRLGALKKVLDKTQVYPVVMIQTRLLVESLLWQDKDLALDDPLSTAASAHAERLQSLKKSGLEVNPANEMQRMLLDALETSEGRKGILRLINALLSAVRK